MPDQAGVCGGRCDAGADNRRPPVGTGRRGRGSASRAAARSWWTFTGSGSAGPTLSCSPASWPTSGRGSRASRCAPGTSGAASSPPSARGSMRPGSASASPVTPCSAAAVATAAGRETGTSARTAMRSGSPPGRGRWRTRSCPREQPAPAAGRGRRPGGSAGRTRRQRPAGRGGGAGRTGQADPRLRAGHDRAARRRLRHAPRAPMSTSSRPTRAAGSSRRRSGPAGTGPRTIRRRAATTRSSTAPAITVFPRPR